MLEEKQISSLGGRIRAQPGLPAAHFLAPEPTRLLYRPLLIPVKPAVKNASVEGTLILEPFTTPDTWMGMGTAAAV